MKKLKRKYAVITAVLTALSAGAAYLITGKWQSAAWSGGIVLAVMVIIALLVFSLVQKGIDLAVDTAGSWLKKGIVWLIHRRAEKAAEEDGSGDQAPPDGTAQDEEEPPSKE